MRNRSSIWLMVVVCSLTLVLAGCGSQKPSDVVVEFYEALQQDEFQKAYDLMSDFYKENHDLAAFEKEIKDIFAERGEITNIDVGKTEMQGSRNSAVNLVLTWTKDGTDTDEERKVNVPSNKGKWRIDSSAFR